MVRTGVLQIALTCHFSLCQVNFVDSISSSVGSQMRGFELRQTSAGPQPPYIVEYLDQMAINRKLCNDDVTWFLGEFLSLKAVSLCWFTKQACDESDYNACCQYFVLISFSTK